MSFGGAGWCSSPALYCIKISLERFLANIDKIGQKRFRKSFSGNIVEGAGQGWEQAILTLIS